MTIKNNTTVTLNIMGGVLKPGKTQEYPERMFYELNIRSEIGSCIIKIEYAIRSFKNYGKLKAEEGPEENCCGMKEIVVSSTD